MEGKIKKSFKQGVPDEKVEEFGVTSFCSWERLKPYIEQACGKHPDEVIVSVIADKDGIKVIYEYK